MRTVLWLILMVGIAGAIYSGWQGRETPLHPDDPRIATGDTRIVMLGAEWCGYCLKQRRDFEHANVSYRLLDVDTEEGARAARALGTRNVPVTVIGQSVIQGYNTAMLDERLTALGYRVY